MLLKIKKKNVNLFIPNFISKKKKNDLKFWKNRSNYRSVT